MSILSWLTKPKKEKMSKSAVLHSNKGEYTKKGGRLKSGGHGEDSFKELDKRLQKYNVIDKFPNGVRLGNVPNHKNRDKQTGTGQTWFPKKWNSKTIKKAGEKVANSVPYKLQDGKTMFGSYKGVKIGMIRTKGKIATVFPQYKQSGGRKKC